MGDGGLPLRDKVVRKTTLLGHRVQNFGLGESCSAYAFGLRTAWKPAQLPQLFSCLCIDINFREQRALVASDSVSNILIPFCAWPLQLKGIAAKAADFDS